MANLDELIEQARRIALDSSAHDRLVMDVLRDHRASLDSHNETDCVPPMHQPFALTAREWREVIDNRIEIRNQQMLATGRALDVVMGLLK